MRKYKEVVSFVDLKERKKWLYTAFPYISVYSSEIFRLQFLLILAIKYEISTYRLDYVKAERPKNLTNDIINNIYDIASNITCVSNNLMKMNSIFIIFFKWLKTTKKKNEN